MLVNYTCCAKSEMKALKVVYEKGGIVLAFVEFVVADVVVGVVVGNDDCNDNGQKENENEKSVGSCHMLTRNFLKARRAKRNEEMSRHESEHPPWEFSINQFPVICHVIAPVT